MKIINKTMKIKNREDSFETNKKLIVQRGKEMLQCDGEKSSQRKMFPKL